MRVVTLGSLGQEAPPVSPDTNRMILLTIIGAFAAASLGSLVWSWMERN